jgi:hypothetical protein
LVANATVYVVMFMQRFTYFSCGVTVATGAVEGVGAARKAWGAFQHQ